MRFIVYHKTKQLYNKLAQSHRRQRPTQTVEKARTQLDWQ